MSEPSIISSPSANKADVANERDLKISFIDGYRWMLLGRTLEDKIASLYHAGKIVGGVYLGRGQEAFSTALGLSLQRGRDIFAPLIRDQSGRMAFGEPLLDATRTYLGSVRGPMQGRDGNIHRGRPAEGIPAMISHLGAMISVVSGMLLGRRFRGIEGQVGAATIGDGGTSTGAFHEGMNTAAIEKLPLVVAVANNHYAYSTPNTSQFACDDLADRAAGYGVEAHRVDGIDLYECLRVFSQAVQRAREGHGPQLVVGKLLRLSGHGEHDDGSYVSADLKASPLGRDCLEVAQQRLVDEDWATASDLKAWEEEAKDKVMEAVSCAQQEPKPDPYNERWINLASSWLIEGTASHA
ncbi:MAG: TPP-dependent pyruvate/acetoin dehydrogenase alpha subunit [Verrucomicrobiales bacterium]|jgi:TPP-dependent pyruvate/acetoin dehydrogenase alpha subunit